jgi:hypothetical protein
MNIGPYLDVLVRNEKIFEALKNKYPEILADLTSAKFNPTCSCRGRVAAHLNKKYQEGDKDFIDFLLNMDEIKDGKAKIDEMLKKIEEKNKEKAQEVAKDTSVSNIYQVPKGPKAWEDFHKFVNEKGIPFRGFSLLDKGDYLEVYFL